MTNSYIIWMLDGKYTIGWGSSPEEARESYLRNWAKSIREVTPTDSYRNPLPQHLYISCPVMEVSEPSIHAPLPTLVKPSVSTESTDNLKAELAELKALVLSLAKGQA